MDIHPLGKSRDTIGTEALAHFAHTFIRAPLGCGTLAVGVGQRDVNPREIVRHHLPIREVQAGSGRIGPRRGFVHREDCGTGRGDGKIKTALRVMDRVRGVTGKRIQRHMAILAPDLSVKRVAIREGVGLGGPLRAKIFQAEVQNARLLNRRRIALRHDQVGAGDSDIVTRDTEQRAAQITNALGIA